MGRKKKKDESAVPIRKDGTCSSGRKDDTDKNVTSVLSVPSFFIASKAWVRNKPRTIYAAIVFSVIAAYFIVLFRENRSLAQFRSSFVFGVPGFSKLRSACERQGTVWMQYPIINDETNLMLQRLKENLTSPFPCVRKRTHKAYVLGFPKVEWSNVVRLDTDKIHRFTIVSYDSDGVRRCNGGDYFETDLNGPYWKSRPLLIDLGDGSYELKIQVDIGFAGLYNFKVVLLFANFHGLSSGPAERSPWFRDEMVASFEIEFVVPKTKPKPAELKTCGAEDLISKLQWSGRWTREKYNQSCGPGPDGRFLCMNSDTPCESPWCEGPLGRLESNGWVYSAHCAFKIFTEEEAWECLDNKWILWWGDTNHQDTARNLLNFVLGKQVSELDLKFNKVFYRIENPVTTVTGGTLTARNTQAASAHEPKKYSVLRQKVRMTNAYYGFDEIKRKALGLLSIDDPHFQNLMTLYFSNNRRPPDFVILNSGLDDAYVWGHDVEKYVKWGVENAVKFWDQTLRRSKKISRVIYRHSVAVAGLARSHAINPQKLELYTKILADRFAKLDLPSFHMVDDFDMTFPWHFDHQCSNGPRYGLPPSKAQQVGGGHQYFVDLMLVHVLLNSMCSK